MKTRRAPRARWRAVIALVLLTTGIVAVGPLAATPPVAAATTRPDIVVVMMDDLTLQQLQYLPKITALAKTGTNFSRYYVSTPECCPSRATFLTGQYIHNHKVMSGIAPTGGYNKLDHTNALPVWLQDSGYHTAHVGKYLNGVGEINPLQRPPGWTDYDGLVDPTTYNYWNYTVNHNGTLENYGTAVADYQTDVLAQKAVDDITSAPTNKPLFLYFAPLSPHAGTVAGTGPKYPVPAPRHRGTFTGNIALTPDLNEVDVSDKPSFISSKPSLTTSQLYSMNTYWRQAVEASRAADDAVGRIVDTLRDTGRLANTVIMFTSDNGFLHGEHRVRTEKLWPYEPDVRVPLFIVGPGFPAGGRVGTLAVSADLAPTIVGLAQATSSVRRTMDGASLLPMVTDTKYLSTRSLLLELGPAVGRLRWAGVMGPKWKYIEYSNGERELYDLYSDPWELVNRANDPAFAATRALMAGRLKLLRTCVGKRCTTIY